MTTLREKRWLGVSLAEAGVLFALATLVAVQHFRHGWPFSLHHERGAGNATPSAETAPHAGHSPPADDHAAHEGLSAPAGEHAAHQVPGRVPVTIEAEKLATFGISFEPAIVEEIGRPVRATATVGVDETRVSHVHARISGWIETLAVNATGEKVRKGQVLATVFSQELLAAQNEYLALKRTAALTGDAILEAARRRMRVLGMTAAQIARLDRTGEAQNNVAILSPRQGIVLRRGVSLGAAIDPGTELLTIADLSTVWVLAEVPEADIPQVNVGAKAHLDFPASGLGPIDAQVAFLYPTLTEQTRTLRVRFILANPDGRIRPGLYGTATIETARRTAVTVRRDAVLDTGEAQYVFIHQPADGAIVPRHVTIGARVGERSEVTSGLSGGEHVVSSGVFLIDSESRLRASTGGPGHGGH